MRYGWAALALLGLAGGAEARQHYPARGHRIVPAVAAPLDSFTQPSGAYSFRKLRSAYTGPALRIRRAGDNAETDINFLGCTSFTGCPWDSAAAAAHCAATTCSVVTLYDQSGNGRNLTQATAANQPVLSISCNGGLPCWEMTTSTQQLAGASFAPTSTTSTIAIVANRAVGTAQAQMFRENGANQTRIQTGAANVWVAAVGGTLNGVATDAQWHSGIAVFSPTAGQTVFGIDGTETTGTTVPALTAGAPATAGIAAATHRLSEVVFWDAYGLTANERTALSLNQRGYWVP